MSALKIPLSIEVRTVKDAPLMLHENIASGEYNGVAYELSNAIANGIRVKYKGQVAFASYWDLCELLITAIDTVVQGEQK